MFTVKNKDDFKDFTESFLRQNSVLNLVSKNDEKYIWEKHIFDSLAIEKVFLSENFNKSLKGLTLLDIGTGGGFPAIPVALGYPDIEVFALDSIGKKINAVNNIKSDLNLTNLHTIHERAENLKGKCRFDIVTSRAVAPLKVILGYAAPLMKENGIFVAYKSVKVKEEIEDAKNILKKFKLKIAEVTEYKLPLKENFVRNLVVVVSCNYKP